jgi:hypothetical protein
MQGSTTLAVAVAHRIVRISVAAIVLLTMLSATATAAADSTRAPNPIEVENARPGTTAWAPRSPSTGKRIEGYISTVSSLPGGSVAVHVSTSPAASYRIQVYRLGWYHGLGGRLMDCVPSCTGSKPGFARRYPTPDPVTGLARASWPVTDRIHIGRHWTSGYYELKLTLTSGPEAGKSFGVPLIVRQPPAQRPSATLVQASVNTWQAYNNWGGKSLYDYNSGGQGAVKVSFDRPYAHGMRHQGPLDWEYELVRFLERHGYDVSYTTDVDTDRHPGTLQSHRLVIANGHDEYWSKTMRDAFDSARSHGVNLGFFGADIADWQVRYADQRRTIVEYRDGAEDPVSDPRLKTTQFRSLDPPRPQCRLLGIMWQGTNGTHAYRPVSTSLSRPWFTGTNLMANSSVTGAVGYEADSIAPGCTPPGAKLTALFHYDGVADGNGNADAVTYTAPSGARILSTGSLNWNRILDDYVSPGSADPRLQRFTRNALSDLQTGH